MKTSLLALAAVAGMALTACDDDASATATTTTTSSTTTASTMTTASTTTASTTTASTTTTAASAESNGGAPGNEVCPLTAEEVSAVIGSTVAEDESCQFGWSFPYVSFAYQPVSACTPDNLRTAGYPTEPFSSEPGVVYGGAVDGFGVDAYAHGYGLGLIFIVCDADQPFELVVEGVQGDYVPVANALATLARDG